MIGLLLIGLVVIGVTAWGAGVLYFTAPGGPGVRATLPVLLGSAALATLGGLFSRRWRWRGLMVFGVLLVPVAVWWSSLTPSNDRVWQPAVARVASATVNGDLVTVRNIRNFDYRSETDFTPRYEERTYDLRRLDRVDLIAVYWMGPAIAHVFLSFGFGEDHLAISIEARKERGEGYSALGGFFRQYELIYVVAAERDVIRLRTNYRKDPPEDVFIKALQEIPVASSVKAHSIVAVDGNGPVEQGDDGVVQYSSAHIAGVESEVVVRSPHSTQGRPETIEEVRRILRAHAGVN